MNVRTTTLIMVMMMTVLYYLFHFGVKEEIGSPFWIVKQNFGIGEYIKSNKCGCRFLKKNLFLIIFLEMECVLTVNPFIVMIRKSKYLGTFGGGKKGFSPFFGNESCRQNPLREMGVYIW